MLFFYAHFDLFVVTFECTALIVQSHLHTCRVWTDNKAWYLSLGALGVQQYVRMCKYAPGVVVLTIKDNLKEYFNHSFTSRSEGSPDHLFLQHSFVCSKHTKTLVEEQSEDSATNRNTPLGKVPSDPTTNLKMLLTFLFLPRGSVTSFPEGQTLQKFPRPK